MNAMCYMLYVELDQQNGKFLFFLSSFFLVLSFYTINCT